MMHMLLQAAAHLGCTSAEDSCKWMPTCTHSESVAYPRATRNHYCRRLHRRCAVLYRAPVLMSEEMAVETASCVTFACTAPQQLHNYYGNQPQCRCLAVARRPSAAP